jgi:hypothetical protein
MTPSGCPLAPVPLKVAASITACMVPLMSRRTACSSASPLCLRLLRVSFTWIPTLWSGDSTRSVVAKVVGPAVFAVSPSAQPAVTLDVVSGYSTRPVSMATICAPMRAATESGKSRSITGRTCFGSKTPEATVSPARRSSACHGSGQPR